MCLHVWCQSWCGSIFVLSVASPISKSWCGSACVLSVVSHILKSWCVISAVSHISKSWCVFLCTASHSLNVLYVQCILFVVIFFFFNNPCCLIKLMCVCSKLYFNKLLWFDMCFVCCMSYVSDVCLLQVLYFKVWCVFVVKSCSKIWCG